MVNSEKYWDGLFTHDDDNIQREEQTKFFAQLALNNLPKWLLEDISDSKMSICDVGCAEGIATELLANEFENSRVVGIDFSPKAIEVAQNRHEKCEYRCGDIKNIDEYFDVLFSSNVLEHFSNPDDILRKMIKFANKYCILLVPFREYYTCAEHFTYFDFQSFPLDLEGYKLCYYKPMTMVGEDIKYWFGEQILVVYAKSEYIQGKNMSLRQVYNGYIEERTAIIQDYDKKLQECSQREEFLKQSLKDNESKFIKQEERAAEILREKEKYQSELEEYKTKADNFDKVAVELIAKRDNEIAKYDNIIKQYEDKVQQISINREGIEHAIERIDATQNSKVYKMSLVFRRFYTQCIKTRDKKEFVKWFFAKLFHKKYAGRALSFFDYLEEAKVALRETKAKAACDEVQTNPVQNPSIVVKRKDISKTVVIFGSVPFYDVGGGQRSAQLAKTFNELGYIVHYIYGFECSEEDIPDMFVPTVTHKLIDEVSVEWYKSIMANGAISIFEIPFCKFKPYMDIAKKFNQPTVYEHIDNWDSNLGSLFYDPDTFKQFIEEADLITVTAKMLGEKIEEKTDREYLYLPNAVNINIFEPGKTYECPHDLRIGKKKTLIYFGSLWGEWFDWEKIIYIAEKEKDVAINLIGDYSGIKDKIAQMPKNIHFLGLKPQTQLPAYLQHCDIALLPFKNCEIGKYVSPLKIFEYIAMNKKVLATNLDDIQHYPNVYASDDKEDWLKFLNSEDEIVSTEEFIGKNNWYSRCAELIEYFEKEESKFPSVSVIVLNYNNKKVIERCVKTLLAHNRRYNYEVIVVDNGSTDGSYELLQENYSDKIKLYKNSVNGCSSGRNLGAANATGEYIIFLDSDQWIVSDYWLDSALDLMENDVNIGSAGWNAGWFEPGKTTGPIVDYLPNRGLESSAIWYKTDIAYLATSGMIMKRELFEAIGGLDEFYDPTCFEDTDLSLKIRDYGFELAYCPYMAIMHLPHQTTQSGSARHTQLMERNGKYFWDKWMERNPKLLEYYL